MVGPWWMDRQGAYFLALPSELSSVDRLRRHTIDGCLGPVYAQSKIRLCHALAEIQNGIFSKSLFSLTKEKSCTLNLNYNFAEANFSQKIMRFPFLLKEILPDQVTVLTVQ